MKALLMLITLMSLVLPGNPARAAEPSGGIGLMLAVEKDSKGPKVVRVMPDSPAARAGIVAGAVIEQIGDVSTEGKSLADCVALIRGPIGSKLTLAVVVPGASTAKPVELTREKLAAPAKAKLRDPASPLVIKEWAQGGPVDVKDGKNLYVVEFWATWCGPCRQSIPHLNELQKKLKNKGVVVVGVSDEAPDTVKPFVKKMGVQMEYAVACDDARQTYANYMDAYGYNGIPTAFVVGKDGRVIWHGHPMVGLDQVLNRFLSEQNKQ